VHDIQDGEHKYLRQEDSVKQTEESLVSDDQEGTASPTCPSTPRKRRRLSAASHPTDLDNAETLFASGSSSFLVGVQPRPAQILRSMPARIANAVPASVEPVHQNVPRLTHFIEEPNVGQGFIKEISFSRDGRLLASPFGFGVRLLAFDSLCHEMCDLNVSDLDVAVQMHEVASNMSHTKEVLAAKFSPTDCLLVTGCLCGKVGFHQPVL
jgi:WD repeat-containing protein 32